MPRIVWNGDATGAVRAQESVTTAQKKSTEEFKVSAREAKKFEDQLKKLHAEAEQVKQSIDPQRKLNAEYARLGELVKRNVLTIDEAARAGANYRVQLGLAAKAGLQVADANERGFGAGAAGNLKSYLTGLISIGGTISLIRSELAAIAALDERAAQRAAGAAGADATLRRVVATDPNGQRAIDAASRIAAEKNIPLSTVQQAMTAAFGAVSDVAISVKSVEAAFQKTRDETAAQETARGIGFILQSSRIKDAQEAGGFIDQILALSPIQDEKVPQALAKVVGSFTSPVAGGSEGTAGAILGLLSQAAADPEGDRSRTGAIQLIPKLDKFFDKNRKKFQLAKDVSDGVDEQLDFLFKEGNEGFARAFIEASTFEAPVSGGFAKLFLDPAYRARFRGAVPELSSREARLGAAQLTSERALAGDIQGTALTNAIVDSAVEGLDLGKAGRGIFTVEQREKVITTVAEALGGTQFGSRLALFASTGPSLDRQEAIDYIGSITNAPDNRNVQNPAMQALREVVEKLTSIDRKNSAKATTRGE